MLRRCTPLLFLVGCAGGAHGRDSATAAGGQITTATLPLTITSAGGTADPTTSDTDDPSSSAGTSGGGGGGGGTSSSTSSTATSAPADSSTTEAPPKFDLGEQPDAGEPPPPDLPPIEPPVGCKAIDVLFILDDSSTIAAEQQTLLAAAPKFLENLVNDLGDTVSSFHVGVATTDNYMHNPFACQAMGALVTSTGGMDSSMQACMFDADGSHFMDEVDDLPGGYACAGLPGTTGSGDERPMEVLTAALGPDLNAPGACNAGFLRDDALLVAVVLTDEDDEHEVAACMGLPQQGSPGGPVDWFAAVADAKGGETNAVILGIWGPVDQPCPLLDQCNGGTFGAEPGVRLDAWAKLFTWQSREAVCAPDYGPFLDDAIPLIDEACGGFVPMK